MIKHILLASSAFKEHLSADVVNSELKRGIKDGKFKGKCTIFTVADGGTGTMQIIGSHVRHRVVSVTTSSPEFDQIKASYIVFKKDGIKTAFIEYASAGGIALSKKRDAINASSYGVGAMIKHALVNSRCNKIILGLGDSATTDCGMGIMQALGVRFYDNDNRLIRTSHSIDISRIHKIDTDQLIPSLPNNFPEIICYCDGISSMGGSDGCWMRAKQKGASESEIIQLERGVNNFMRVCKKQFDIELSDIQMSGCAGGVGGGLKAVLNASLVLGANAVLELLEFEKTLEKIDCVVIGEGQIDNTTFTNKVTQLIANIAKSKNIPVIAVCAQLKDINIKQINQQGINLVLRTEMQNYDGGLEAIKKNRMGKSIVYNTGIQIGNLLSFTMRYNPVT